MLLFIELSSTSQEAIKGGPIMKKYIINYEQLCIIFKILFKKRLHLTSFMVYIFLAWLNERAFFRDSGIKRLGDSYLGTRIPRKESLRRKQYSSSGSYGPDYALLFYG